jgi:hypothetical protein
VALSTLRHSSAMPFIDRGAKVCGRKRPLVCTEMKATERHAPAASVQDMAAA